MVDSCYEIVYYWIEECATLFAYGSYYEFFERYDKASDCWRPSEISYSRFLHDFNGKEIDESAAKIIAFGNLPDKKYEEYRRFINSGGKRIR